MTEEFDTRVHIRDSKSGRVIAENHYRLVVKQEDRGSSSFLYERPPGSGMWYDATGKMNMKASQEGFDKQKREEAEAAKSEEQKYLDRLAAARALVAEADQKTKPGTRLSHNEQKASA